MEDVSLCQVLSHFLLPPVNLTKRFLHSFEYSCEYFLKYFVFCEPPRAMASMLPLALFLGCNRRSVKHWNVSTSLQMAYQVLNLVMMHFLNFLMIHALFCIPKFVRFVSFLCNLFCQGKNN